MTDLSELLDRHNVEHEPLHDHLTNGRPYTFNPVGVMVHHTGSDNSALKTIRYGRTGLPGPLSQFFVEMIPAPKVWVVSSGYCNHAGKGSSVVHERVEADEPPGDTGIDDMYGNRHYYGIEVEGDTPDDFTDSRYDLTVQISAALCREFGWDPATRVISHKEWTTRKVDPAFDMPTFRTAVTEALTVPPLVAVPPPTRFYQESWNRAVTSGLVPASMNPREPITAQRLVYWLDRLELL